MQFSSVFCLVSVLQLVRSIHIELRYNKPDCGPYGFRCLNDRLFEICAEFKRSSDEFSDDEDNLYPPIGSKALCPEGRECDNDNPYYCTLEREERHEHVKRKHKKCDEKTTTPPTTTHACEEKGEGAGEDDEMSTQVVEEECQTEASCDKNKQPAIVFDESKSKAKPKGHAHGHAQGHTNNSQMQGAEAPTYQIHSQGDSKEPCGKHAHKPETQVFKDCSAKVAHDSPESPCSPSDNFQHEESPPVVFYESNSQGAQSGSCDHTQPEETPPVVFYESSPQGAQSGSCGNQEQEETTPVIFYDSNSQGIPNGSCDNSQEEDTSPVVFYESNPQEAQSGSCDNPHQKFEDQNNGTVYDLYPADVPDMTTAPPPETQHSPCGYRCIRAGNYPDLKDSTKYFFCDINNNGDGFVACHKSCHSGEVFNDALRECIPIENLHADTKRHSGGFKCVKCGDFPDPNDAHKYFHCEKSYSRCPEFSTSHESCPKGTRFIKPLKRCGGVSHEREENKRDVTKNGTRCCGGGEPPYPSPPNNCIVVMSTPEPSSCGSGDDEDNDEYEGDYEEGPQMPGSKQDSDDEGCGAQSGGRSQGCQGGAIHSSHSHPAIKLPKQHHFNCHGAGKFADPYNCTTFFVCHPKRAESGFQKLHMVCPSGEVFDEARQRCVHGNAQQHGLNSNEGL